MSDSESGGSQGDSREASEVRCLAVYNAALALHAEGRIDDAWRHYEALLAAPLIRSAGPPADPGAVTVDITLRLAYLTHKNAAAVLERLPTPRLGEALEHLLQAVRFDATDPAVWYSLGRLAVQHGDARIARNSFERGLALASGHWGCLDKLCVLLYHIRDLEPCAAWLVHALRRDRTYARGIVMARDVLARCRSPATNTLAALVADPITFDEDVVREQMNRLMAQIPIAAAAASPVSPECTVCTIAQPTWDAVCDALYRLLSGDQTPAGHCTIRVQLVLRSSRRSIGAKRAAGGAGQVANDADRVSQKCRKWPARGARRDASDAAQFNRMTRSVGLAAGERSREGPGEAGTFHADDTNPACSLLSQESVTDGQVPRTDMPQRQCLSDAIRHVLLGTHSSPAALDASESDTQRSVGQPAAFGASADVERFVAAVNVASHGGMLGVVHACLLAMLGIPDGYTETSLVPAFPGWGDGAVHMKCARSFCRLQQRLGRVFGETVVVVGAAHDASRACSAAWCDAYLQLCTAELLCYADKCTEEYGYKTVEDMQRTVSLLTSQLVRRLADPTAGVSLTPTQRAVIRARLHWIMALRQRCLAQSGASVPTEYTEQHLKSCQMALQELNVDSIPLPHCGPECVLSRTGIDVHLEQLHRRDLVRKRVVYIHECASLKRYNEIVQSFDPIFASWCVRRSVAEAAPVLGVPEMKERSDLFDKFSNACQQTSQYDCYARGAAQCLLSTLEIGTEDDAATQRAQFMATAAVERLFLTSTAISAHTEPAARLVTNTITALADCVAANPAALRAIEEPRRRWLISVAVALLKTLLHGRSGSQTSAATELLSLPWLVLYSAAVELPNGAGVSGLLACMMGRQDRTCGCMAAKPIIKMMSGNPIGAAMKDVPFRVCLLVAAMMCTVSSSRCPAPVRLTRLTAKVLYGEMCALSKHAATATGASRDSDAESDDGASGYEAWLRENLERVLNWLFGCVSVGHSTGIDTAAQKLSELDAPLAAALLNVLSPPHSRPKVLRPDVLEAIRAFYPDPPLLESDAAALDVEHGHVDGPPTVEGNYARLMNFLDDPSADAPVHAARYWRRTPDGQREDVTDQYCRLCEIAVKAEDERSCIIENCRYLVSLQPMSATWWFRLGKELWRQVDTGVGDYAGTPVPGLWRKVRHAHACLQRACQLAPDRDEWLIFLSDTAYFVAKSCRYIAEAAGCTIEVGGCAALLSEDCLRAAQASARRACDLVRDEPSYWSLYGKWCVRLGDPLDAYLPAFAQMVRCQRLRKQQKGANEELADARCQFISAILKYMRNAWGAVTGGGTEATDAALITVEQHMGTLGLLDRPASPAAVECPELGQSSTMARWQRILAAAIGELEDICERVYWFYPAQYRLSHTLRHFSSRGSGAPEQDIENALNHCFRVVQRNAQKSKLGVRPASLWCKFYYMPHLDSKLMYRRYGTKFVNMILALLTDQRNLVQLVEYLLLAIALLPVCAECTYPHELRAVIRHYLAVVAPMLQADLRVQLSATQTMLISQSDTAVTEILSADTKLMQLLRWLTELYDANVQLGATAALSTFAEDAMVACRQLCGAAAAESPDEANTRLKRLLKSCERTVRYRRCRCRSARS